jgi:hypothetical protein
MADALRHVLGASTDPARPGRLRMALAARLGPEDSHRLRALLHQVVIAAEENLPTALRRISPLTTEALRRLSTELATARGWNEEAAERTTRVWVAALGREDLAHAAWGPSATVSRPAPDTHHPVPLDVTVAPPGPSPARLAPAPPRAPHATSAGGGPPPPGTGWPKAPTQLAAHTHARSGEPARGVVLAYSGMNLVLCVVLVLLLLTALLVPVVVWDVTGLLLPVVGMLLASLLVRGLRRGALVATDGGLEFTPYDQLLRKPRPEGGFAAPWPEVSVSEGYVSALHLAGHRVQVGPRNRAFARLAATAGGGR